MVSVKIACARLDKLELPCSAFTMTKAVKRQSLASARLTRIHKRYGLIPSRSASNEMSPTLTGTIPGDITIPSVSLPPPPVTSPITAVMDTSNPMATSLPKVTRAQLKYERRQLKKMPKQLARIRKLNELREMQEYTMNQQIGAPSDMSLLRGGPQYMGPTQQPVSMFDPMAAGGPPSFSTPQPGGYGPPTSHFSPTAFQQPQAMPSGGLMLPPSQSGVPGGLIYTNVPEITQDLELSNEPMIEDENEEFAAYFAEYMEPLDSYGAATGEPAQVGFFDKLTGLVSAAGDKYVDIAKANAAAKRAKYQADYSASRVPTPAASQMSVGGGLDRQSLLSLGLVLLGGILILRAVRK